MTWLEQERCSSGQGDEVGCERSLRERISRDRYGVRLRALPTGQDSTSGTSLVISDFFRGKGLVLERLKPSCGKWKTAALTPEEQFRFRVLPFTEREARERGL
jgi:hypothetical protein